MTGSDTSNSPQHSEDTPHAHTWCCLMLLLCGRVVCGSVLSECCLVMCELCKKKTEKLRAEKTASPNVTYVQGDSGCGNPDPGDVAEHPGICLVHAQGKKRLKGLPRATPCTDGAQTYGNVTPTVQLCPLHMTFRIKVRAKRGVPEPPPPTIIRTHIYKIYPPNTLKTYTGI